MLIGQKFWRGVGAGALSACVDVRGFRRVMPANGSPTPNPAARSGTPIRNWMNRSPGRACCTNGHADGSGTVKWLKGNDAIETDEGEWRDGRQAGKGIQNWPIGRYEGELADGLPNGEGVLTFQKYRYEGQFRDGKPNGIGTLTAGNETVQGTWKDGCLQGATESLNRYSTVGLPLTAVAMAQCLRARNSRSRRRRRQCVDFLWFFAADFLP